jgi:hypothetical protein
MRPEGLERVDAVRRHQQAVALLLQDPSRGPEKMAVVLGQ